MANLKDILREEYSKQISKLDLRTLLEMVEEVLDSPITITEEDVPQVANDADEQQVLEMILKMIPEIEVSEIGWSDVRTPEHGAEIKGPQRKLLEDYLNNIEGTTLKEKIQSVSSFYSDGANMIEEQAGADRGARITQAISYLVFYKTLTKVITNFNASSAGFSFESFLSALCNGYQIKTGNKTIADYVDRSDPAAGDVPVSLKLYREGGLHVGGSFTDLVRDLTMAHEEAVPWSSSFPNAMRYVVCTKELSGEDLEQTGEIRFWQFDFTLDNVVDILAQGTPLARKCIMFPKEVISALKMPGKPKQDIDLSNRLPGEMTFPSDQELESDFIDYLVRGRAKRGDEQEDIRGILQGKGLSLPEAHLKALLNDLDYSGRDEIFTNYIVTTKEGEQIDKGIVRGRSGLNKDLIRKILKDYDWLPMRDGSGKKFGEWQLANAIIAANNAVIKSQSKKKQADERAAELKRMMGADEFLSPEESARQYDMLLNAEAKKIALRNSWGILTTGHWNLNQTQATNAGPPVNADPIGSIRVGRAEVGTVINSIRSILNEEVTEIFQSLKILSDSLNAFFAGGLKDDSLATAAVENADNISSKPVLGTGKQMRRRRQQRRQRFAGGVARRGRMRENEEKTDK